MAARFVGSASHVGELKLKPLFKRFEYADSFGNYFPADAIARQHGDVHRRR